mmetsp:Transcript_58390/g.126321  ORF Transcript_58390/g.126321 Transcript_58390/m.126321 type:complete len:205 (-) Transcript_58390:2-616(-)
MRVCLIPSLAVNLPAADNGDGHPRSLVQAGGDLSNGTNDVHAVDNLAKDDVPAIKLRSPFEQNHELRAVAVATLVGHAKNPGLSVSPREVLVIEGGAVDALPARAGVRVEVPRLHQVFARAEEGAPLITKPLPSSSANAVLAGAESPKVLRCARRDVGKKLEDYSTTSAVANGDIQEDPRILHHGNPLRSARALGPQRMPSVEP